MRRFVVRGLSRPHLDIRVHDVLKDDLPQAQFDLVHLRLLLAWLSEPQTALQRLTAALKPGGWLLAEEMDFASVAADPRIGEAAQDVSRVSSQRITLSWPHGTRSTPTTGVVWPGT